MPVPASINDLSTTAGSNSPSGGENPFPDLDNHIRALASFIAVLRDGKLDASTVSAFMLTVLNDADAATARATLGAVGLTGDQTVAGVKTFSSSPVAPTPTTGDNTTKVATTAFVKTASDSAVSNRVRVEYRAAQTTSGGTEYEFTSIPSWANRLTVPLNGVSTSGVNNPLIQIGAGSYTVSGYAGSQTRLTNVVATSNLSSGFQIGGDAAVSARSGDLTLHKTASGTWEARGVFGFSDSAGVSIVGGVVDIGGTLDRLRIYAGGDTFDGGAISLVIEG